MALFDFLDLQGDTMAGQLATEAVPKITGGYQEGIKDATEAQAALQKLQEVDRKMGMDAFDIRNKIADRPMQNILNMQKINVLDAEPKVEHIREAAKLVLGDSFKGKVSAEQRNLIQSKAKELANKSRPVMDPYDSSNFLKAVQSGEIPVASEGQMDINKYQSNLQSQLLRDEAKFASQAEIERIKAEEKAKLDEANRIAAEEKLDKTLNAADKRQGKMIGAMYGRQANQQSFAEQEAQKKKANAAVTSSINSYRKFSNPSANPTVAKKIVSDYQAIKSMGVPEETQRFYEAQQEVLTMAGEGPPGWTGKSVSSKVPAAEAKPRGQTKTIPGMGTYELVGNKWKKIK